MKNIIIKPILTEKMAEQGEKLNRYAFVVNRKANKIEIRKAFEEYYDVSVISVNSTSSIESILVLSSPLVIF